MKFIKEYRDAKIIKDLSEKIKKVSKKEIVLMEVCGGHTMAIHRFGVPSLLPRNIKLISGPGCPVCVSGIGYVDAAIDLAQQKDVVIITYGDLIRVPGSKTSLEKEKSKGADIRVVYSTMEVLEIAEQNPDKKVIFLGIGFETTAPATAVAIQKAFGKSIKNFFVLSTHKIMPPVMEALLNEKVRIDGFICPGHVSTITGSRIYNFIPEKYKIACVITGFEPIDLMQSIYMLVKQVNESKPNVEIQYSRAVSIEGNKKAQDLMNEVFETRPDNWRGIGKIPDSGLKIRSKYAAFDAEKVFNIKVDNVKEHTSCICGQILRGQKTPKDCKLFGMVCSPDNPVGACMVSSEGVCNAFYKYRNYA